MHWTLRTRLRTPTHQPATTYVNCEHLETETGDRPAVGKEKVVGHALQSGPAVDRRVRDMARDSGRLRTLRPRDAAHPSPNGPGRDTPTIIPAGRCLADECGDLEETLSGANRLRRHRRPFETSNAWGTEPPLCWAMLRAAGPGRAQRRGSESWLGSPLARSPWKAEAPSKSAVVSALTIVGIISSSRTTDHP
jgi:hypothetical protein